MNQPEKSQKDILDEWIVKVDAITKNRFLEHWQMQRIDYILNAYIIPFFLEVFLCAVAIAFVNYWISIRYSIQTNLPWFMGIVGVLIPRIANPPIPYMVRITPTRKMPNSCWTSMHTLNSFWKQYQNINEKSIDYT